MESDVITLQDIFTDEGSGGGRVVGRRRQPPAHAAALHRAEAAVSRQARRERRRSAFHLLRPGGRGRRRRRYARHAHHAAVRSLRMSGRARYLAVAVAALVAAAPAAAGVELSGVDTSSFPTIHATVVSSAGAAATPVVTENGLRVVGLDAENLGRAKAVVLAVDDSQSMAGKPLAAAAAAARSFVAAKPSADAIAVVEFGRRPIELSGLSTATIDADTALSQITRSGAVGNGAVRRNRPVLGSAAQELAPEPRAHRPHRRTRRLEQRLARRCGRRRPRRERLDLPDRHRGTGLRSAAASAAGARDRRPLLRRCVDGRAHERVLLDRRPPRPHVAHLVRDRRAAGRQDPRRGDGAGRRVGDVVRRRRSACRRRHGRAVGVEAPAVERVRIGRPGSRRSPRRSPGGRRVPAPARYPSRLVAAQPARPAHGRHEHDVASPPRQDEPPHASSSARPRRRSAI